MLVRVAPADSLRYKYLNMRWCAVGESDVVQNEEKQILRHASSPNNGMFWMRKPISFKNIKITNNSRSKNGNVSFVLIQSIIQCIPYSNIINVPSKLN